MSEADTVTKIELKDDERRPSEEPRMIPVGGMNITCEVAVTFPLFLPKAKAQEIERLYFSNPQPAVELAVWLGALTWTCIGKIIGIEKHSISSAGNFVWDVTFEPDDKKSLQVLKLRIQQARQAKR